MSAAIEANKAGLKGVGEVSKLTKVSPQTLYNWYKNKPLLFSVVLDGCRWRKQNDAHP